MLMKYAVVTSPHQIEIRETQVPEPAEGELQVKVSLCGMDWPTFRHVIEGVDTSYPASGLNNLNLAHEGSGVVTAVGKNIKKFSVGDRITYLGPGFQEYATVKAEYCGKVPDKVDELDLLGEPMAVMYHSAVRSLESRPETIVVFGAGYMGLGIIHFLLRLDSGCQVIAVERNEARLKVAEQMGASRTVNPDRDDPFNIIGDLTDGKGADLAIEATGSDTILHRIHQAVKPAGTVLFHGWFSGEKKVRLDNWHAQDLTVKFSHPAPPERYGNLIEKVAELVAENKIDLKPLITHQFRFYDATRLEDLIKNATEYIKGVIRI